MVEYYQSIFQFFGSHSSALTVVPFNQASKQDLEALVDYIYTNLGMDFDYSTASTIGPILLTVRMMSVNLRIFGAVKNKKASRRFATHPTQVILPLSPTLVFSETMG